MIANEWLVQKNPAVAFNGSCYLVVYWTNEDYDHIKDFPVVITFSAEFGGKENASKYHNNERDIA